MATGKRPVVTDHGLELLLDYNGRVEHLPAGYSMRFEIRRVEPTPNRPHGLKYSFTLHDPSNKRILGYDNAHEVRPLGRGGKRRKDFDHWHRTVHDKGRPYEFTDAATLLQDFYSEVARVMRERGYDLEVTGEENVD